MGPQAILLDVYHGAYGVFCCQRNLVAQTGDPTGTGKGGESVNG